MFQERRIHLHQFKLKLIQILQVKIVVLLRQIIAVVIIQVHYLKNQEQNKNLFLDFIKIVIKIIYI